MRALIVIFVTAMTLTAGDALAQSVKAKGKKSWRGRVKDFKKPSRKELKKTLTEWQFKVTQDDDTEPAFENEYWQSKKEGIYVDIVSGEPLFSSTHKYDSKTGWPSFYETIVKEHIVRKRDWKLVIPRTEVRSKYGDNHLGHVFKDGPKPTGLRYCINSAALRFVPKEDLEKEGYGEFLKLFGAKKSENLSNEFIDRPSKASAKNLETATIAGGCFWGVEELLRKLPGVVVTDVGYTGGDIDNPSYDIVKLGASGHAEAVQVKFDPKKISYESILKYFFRLHDPTTLNQQGNDIGTQYRSAIFYHSEAQKKTAEAVIKAVDASGKWKKPVVTQIVAASKFTRAENEHQDYLQKNPNGYTCHFLRD